MKKNILGDVVCDSFIKAVYLTYDYLQVQEEEL